MYVFVNNARGEKPEFLVARSEYVAEKVSPSTASTGSQWYSFLVSDRPTKDEGWEQFGDPNPDPGVAAAMQAESQVGAQVDSSPE